MSEPSAFLLVGFSGLLVLVLAAAFVIAVRFGEARPAAVLAVLGPWLLFTGGVAQAGLLARFELRPPPVLVVGVGIGVGAVWLGRSAWAGRVASAAPWWLLLGFHAFRLPLELLMHRAYSEGVMPGQMSYSGYNFDIVTGVLALALGAWAWRAEPPRAVLWAFNAIGLVLLATVVSIAIVSTPVFGWFGPERLNLWITIVPFVWLPAIFVAFALLGHWIAIRRLLADPAR